MKLDPKIGRSLKKASPTILTCIGAAGVVATAVLAVKATPKADIDFPQKLHRLLWKGGHAL